MRNGLLTPALATGVTANLTSLQDTLSNLERICNTPLPFAYQAHLRMSLWCAEIAVAEKVSTKTLLCQVLSSLPSIPDLQGIHLGHNPRNCFCCILAPWFP